MGVAPGSARADLRRGRSGRRRSLPVRHAHVRVQVASFSLGLLLFVSAACARNTEPPEPSGAAPNVRLTVATWNLHWLHRSENEGEVARSSGDYARLRRYADSLDADVIALQEVDGPQAAARVFDPGSYAFHFTSDERSTQRTGFAFRHSLVVSPRPDLADLAIEKTRRGADIAVRFGRTEIRLLSVHLKSGCWDDRAAAAAGACEILRAQWPVLERWIDARALEGTPFVVLGDFNRRFTDADPLWTEIDDGRPANAILHRVTAGRRSRCWNGEFPAFVDHIVLDRLASRWLVPGSFRQLLYDSSDTPHKRRLSDHCALAVTLASNRRP